MELFEPRQQEELNKKLWNAVKKKKADEVSQLLDQNADANYAAVDIDSKKQLRQYSILRLACIEGDNKSIVELLVKKGANVNESDERRWTALHLAANGGKRFVLEVLLRNKADINATTKSGWTSLHLAAWAGHKDIVEILLRYGANPNVVDKELCTPLHRAASWGNHVIIKLLLKHKANPDLVNKLRRTALQEAEEKDHTQAVQLLKAPKQTVAAPWSQPDDIIQSEDDEPTPVMSFGAVIDGEGGECTSEYVSLVVPEGAVSMPLAFSADTYVDTSVMPQLDDERQLVMSPVVQLSPTNKRFNEPVRLSLPPSVPLKFPSDSAESGCLLKLKMTDGSIEDPSCEWYTAMELNTATGNVIKHHQDVEFDPIGGEIRLRQLRTLCWTGEVPGLSLKRVEYAVFGKEIDAKQWNIQVDIIYSGKKTYEDVLRRMKELSFTPLCPPRTSAIGDNGEITLEFECRGEWQLCCEEDAKCDIDASTIMDCYSYSVNMQDSSATAKALRFAVHTSFHSNGKQLEAPKPFKLVVGHPLVDSASTPGYGSVKRDHFHSLVVCSSELELQAAKGVFETDTNCKFKSAHTDLPFNVRICRDWNSSGTNMALVAQPRPGVFECMKLIPHLEKHFTADLIAMTGTCAGEEDKVGNVEHGCVLVARRATTVIGGRETSEGSHETQAQYKEVDRGLAAFIDQLVYDGSSQWTQYIPKKAYPPSPRYIRELILDFVKESGKDGIAKGQLIKQLEQRMPDMNILVFEEILQKMEKQDDSWLQLGGKHKEIYMIAEGGERYYRRESAFLREDKISVIFESMGTIMNEREDLASHMATLRQQLGDRSVKGIDHEAYSFMDQATNCFEHGLAVVMKGISDYGTTISEQHYYKRLAASTPAAFLRHFITKRMALKKEELKKKQEEELKRKQEEALKKKQEELKKKQEDLKKKQEEALKKKQEEERLRRDRKLQEQAEEKRRLQQKIAVIGFMCAAVAATAILIFRRYLR